MPDPRSDRRRSLPVDRLSAHPADRSAVRRACVRAVLTASLTGALACSSDGLHSPPLGDCAEIPEGSYTWGTVGIGTCLSGPTDARFFTADGRTWLGITNADPFRDFTGGSFLVLDADALFTQRGEVPIGDLDAHALDMEPYVGRMGLSSNLGGAGGVTALVSGRASGDSFIETDDDRVWVVDLSSPTAPVYGDPRFLPVKADPYAIEIDPVRRRGFVIQSTDLSASVIDLSGSTPTLFDPADDARVTVDAYARTAGSLGLADLVVTLPNTPNLPRNAEWSVTHVPDTARLWAPGPLGLTRHVRDLGSGEVWVPTAFGVELAASDYGLSTVDDPLLTTRELDEGTELGLVFSDGTDIRRAGSGGTAGDWLLDSAPILFARDGDRARLSAPSIAAADGVTRMYVDARPEGSEAAVITWATTADGLSWSLPQDEASAVMSPPAGYTALAQPWVLRDPHTDALRMWMSMDDGTTWTIGHAVSTDDGRTWTEPVEILDGAGADLGAPVVYAVGGEYRLMATLGDGFGWTVVHATGVDGLAWTTPTPVLDLSADPSASRPPRVALQPAGAGAWRVAQVPDLVETELAVAGVSWPDTTTDDGFTLRVASGHFAGTGTLRDAEGGLLPGALLSVSGLDTLYATVVDVEGRARLAALRAAGSTWGAAADDLIPSGGGGNVAGVSSPAVAATATGGLAMVYAAEDAGGLRRMRLATSNDGLDWTPSGSAILPDLGGWAGVRREPGSLEIDGDTWTLWFAGSDGSRWRIGQARSTDGGASWSLVPGITDAWTLGNGEAGTFDDSGVRHPSVVRDGNTTTLFYAGFDGTTWRIGQASRTGSSAWVRRVSPVTERPAPVLSEIEGTFAVEGVRSPVVGTLGGAPVVLHAGSDGRAWRIGRADRAADGLFPAHRVARAGDGFTFQLHRGQRGRSQIDLAETIDGFPLPGVPGNPARDGPTSAVLDANRGFLYVASKDLSGLIVVDIRDDSTATVRDDNAFDIEAVLRFDSVLGTTGIQDLTLGSSDTLYVTLREPDAVGVVDLSGLVDNATAEVIDTTLRATLSMHDRTDDRGEETFASVGGAGLAHVPGEELLLTTHFRDNSLSVFDLRQGVGGQEIRYVRDLAENPHLVRVAPSGDYAVVLGYLGGDVDRGESSSLVVLDLRENEPTYLEPLAVVRNR